MAQSKTLLLGSLLAVTTLACFSDAGSADSNASGANTTSTTGETDCPQGSAGCPCYGNETCDGDLQCLEGACFDPDCSDGELDCMCFSNGTCNAGLECSVDGSCKPPAGTTGDTDGTGDTGDTGQVECPAGGSCLSAPDGWNGPVLVGSVCGGGLNAADIVNGDLQWEPQACTCECGTPKGVDCEAEVDVFAADGCSQLITTHVVGPNNCEQISLDSTTVESFRVVSTTWGNSGSCTPSVNAQPLSVPTWGTEYHLCSGFEACTSGVCVPEPGVEYPTGVCIWREDEFECPGDFPVEVDAHRDWTDNRGCQDNCTCGSVEGVTCNGPVRISELSNCSHNVGQVPAGDAPVCKEHPAVGPPAYLRYFEDDDGGSCDAGGSAPPSGGVSPTLPVSICCVG